MKYRHGEAVVGPGTHVKGSCGLCGHASAKRKGLWVCVRCDFLKAEDEPPVIPA